MAVGVAANGYHGRQPIRWTAMRGRGGGASGRGVGETRAGWSACPVFDAAFGSEAQARRAPSGAERTAAPQQATRHSQAKKKFRRPRNNSFDNRTVYVKITARRDFGRGMLISGKGAVYLNIATYRPKLVTRRHILSHLNWSVVRGPSWVPVVAAFSCFRAFFRPNQHSAISIQQCVRVAGAVCPP